MFWAEVLYLGGFLVVGVSIVAIALSISSRIRWPK